MSKHLFFLALLTLCAFGYSPENHTQTETKGDTSQQTKQRGWQHTVFVASGWGTPQGMRTELGYTFENVSFGLTFGIGDNWSNDPGEGTLGMILNIHFPNQSETFVPYMLLGYGGTIAIFGGPDTYALVNFGAMIPITLGFNLRPELAIVFTSKHISGGASLFGNDTPTVNDNETFFGFNLLVEFDLKRQHISI